MSSAFALIGLTGIAAAAAVESLEAARSHSHQPDLNAQLERHALGMHGT